MGSSVGVRTGLRTLIAAHPQNHLSLVRVLEDRCGHHVIRTVAAADELLRYGFMDGPQLIVCEPACCGLEAMRQVCLDDRLPTVAMLSTAELDDCSPMFAEIPMACVAKPFADDHLMAAVRVACARAHAEAELRNENSRLTEQLQNRKVIERAKGVLMTRYRWSEHDAFRRLQRCAMNQRKSMANLAEAVINGEVVPL